ncbi:MAG: hypothetical protein IIA06_13070 [Proteobacteria bacterium]|nr:hypothetical protein [Pseudomonadota bacterium]
MKDIIKIVVAIMVFIALGYGVDEYRNHKNIAVMESEWEQIQSTAKENYSDSTPVEAIYKASKEFAEDELENIKSNREKLHFVANSFFGFYFINTRSRNNYCENLGVDITPYVNAFAHYNKSEYQRAITIYAQAGTDKEQQWSYIKPYSIKMVEQDMQEIADTNQITLEEACKLFADNPEFASEMTFAKRASAVTYQVLMDTEPTN